MQEPRITTRDGEQILKRLGEEMEPMSGIEPPTYGLRNRCSTTELHWLGDRNECRNH